MKASDIGHMNETLKNMAFPVVMKIENDDGTSTDAVIRGLTKVQMLAGMIASGFCSHLGVCEAESMARSSVKIAEKILEATK